MKKTHSIIMLIVSLAVSLTSLAQTKTTEITVDFKIRNLGINVDGYFKKASITTNFTSDDSSNWLLYGTVDTGSIDTDNKKRDAHLLKDDFFDVENYPEITLKVTSFQKVSETTYDALVNLTIKGITKAMKIPIEIIGDINSFKLRSNFEINRRDFDVGGGSLILSNTVKIRVNYLFKN
ncbi:Polyisoprenoid-binding protein YceI [Formosa sp. Hel1_31_208]|uniref:YceI family protein n=1 Tax=Formosa sp. Hel1_31_208 TaxID=1798225 RepID=UPI00087C2991|nr:YceI family protein [Formosa sp. Hel1_31_208]SDR72799.1 Polyisoprenoid-binding protein YceI [Formosa sp. Hel1_31_208]